MSEENKRPFIQDSERDKERYNREMIEYKKNHGDKEAAPKLGKRPASKSPGKGSANKRQKVEKSPAKKPAAKTPKKEQANEAKQEEPVAPID